MEDKDKISGKIIMRSQVYFRDVASLSVVKSDGSNLFPNVAIASGDSNAEKSQEALRVLMNYPSIDSVVVLRDLKKDSDIPLDSFGRLCVGHKMKIDANPADILGSDTKTTALVLAHLKQRRAQSSQSDSSFEVDVARVSNFFRDASASSLSIGQYAAIESTMTYYPSFGRGVDPSAFINCHIDDEGTFDVRRVDCDHGSGTILFNAKDFRIDFLQREGRKKFLPVMLSNNVSCLVLPEGASVFIREPSEKMLKAGNMPSVHAHGIGPLDGSTEERLTFKHDLIL